MTFAKKQLLSRKEFFSFRKDKDMDTNISKQLNNNSIDTRLDEIKELAYKASEEKPVELLADIYDKQLINKIPVSKNNYRNILIYGAGKLGYICMRLLQQDKNFSFKIIGFLDKNADNIKEFYGHKVFHTNDTSLDIDCRKNMLIVFALFLPYNDCDNLEQDLRKLGYEYFCNAMHNLGIFFSDKIIEATGRAYFADDSEQIIKTYNMLSDDHSRYVFHAVFRSHALFNYDIPTLSEGMSQYIDVDVPFRNNYQVFVDCGAYTGDTLITLVERHMVDLFIGFEPDNNNFAALVNTYDNLKKNAKNIKNAILLPMGVSDKNELTRFSGTGSSAKIDKNGENIIHSVRLDDVLKGYSNLMIKMDVEGAEASALNGAKRTIIEKKPDLAICVYHKVEDLWCIPTMLHDWVPEYKFYLRNHHPYTMETVLYATI